MIIDNTTIILCVALLLLTAVALIANPFFRSLKAKATLSSPQLSTLNPQLPPLTPQLSTLNPQLSTLPSPPLTVIVLAQNHFETLDKHLPFILSQDYEPGYEVIIVGEKGNLDLEAVLNKYASNPRLYTTYIPKRSLFMSKPKLSASLGIKAAHNDWIVMLDASCCPVSTAWLKNMAEHIDSNHNLVIGYTNYEASVPSFRRFVRLHQACYLLHQAMRGMAYTSCGSNIMFRRSEFIAEDGYRGNLQHVHGEYAFIVNKFAKPRSSSIALHPEAFLRESCPTKKSWSERCIANSHINHHLDRTAIVRTKYILDTVLMYLAYAAILGVGIFGAFTCRYIALLIAVLCLIATVAIRIWLVKRKCRIFHEHIPAAVIPFYELSLVWFDMLTKLRYAKADKHDFSTHKI